MSMMFFFESIPECDYEEQGSGKSENLGTENPSQTWQWGNRRIEQPVGRRLAARTCSPAAAQTVSETKDQT